MIDTLRLAGAPPEARLFWKIDPGLVIHGPIRHTNRVLRHRKPFQAARGESVDPTAVINRFTALSRKHSRTIAYGLRPTALRGRWIGPRVLLNSVPKSGTNLLENALLHFPLLRGSPSRTLRGWDAVDERTLAKIRRIKKGQYLTAHIPAHEQLLLQLRSLDVKVLFMIRDPRDIVISHFKYVTNIDRTHRVHDVFANLPDDDTRLLAVINGIPGTTDSIGEVFRRFAGWLREPSVLTIRFEDLIGSKGGGDDELQLNRIDQVASYLGLRCTDHDCREIASRVFSTRTPTFRSGKVGNWSKHLTPYHLAALRKQLGEAAAAYGYSI